MRFKSILPLVIFAYTAIAQAGEFMSPGTYLCQFRKPYDFQVEVNEGNRISFSRKINAINSPTQFTAKFTLQPVSTDDPTQLVQTISISNTVAVLNTESDSSIPAPYVFEDENGYYEIKFYGPKVDFLCRGNSCSPILATLNINLNDEVILKKCAISGDAQ